MALSLRALKARQSYLVIHVNPPHVLSFIPNTNLMQCFCAVQVDIAIADILHHSQRCPCETVAAGGGGNAGLTVKLVMCTVVHNGAKWFKAAVKNQHSKWSGAVCATQSQHGRGLTF